MALRIVCEKTVREAQVCGCLSVPRRREEVLPDAIYLFVKRSHVKSEKWPIVFIV